MRLEDQYRLLGRVFPRRWRELYGDELVATLLDDSKPGQRFASVADVVDVSRRGVQLRLRNGGPLLLILLATTLLVATTGVIHVVVTPTSFAFLATSLVVVLAPGTGLGAPHIPMQNPTPVVTTSVRYLPNVQSP